MTKTTGKSGEVPTHRAYRKKKKKTVLDSEFLRIPTPVTRRLIFGVSREEQ